MRLIRLAGLVFRTRRNSSVLFCGEPETAFVRWPPRASHERRRIQHYLIHAVQVSVCAYVTLTAEYASMPTPCKTIYSSTMINLQCDPLFIKKASRNVEYMAEILNETPFYTLSIQLIPIISSQCIKISRKKISDTEGLLHRFNLSCKKKHDTSSCLLFRKR